MKNFIDTLKKRDLFEQSANPEVDIKAIYCGFDATASSLQIGNLTPLSVLKKASEHGIKTIALLGGATTQIGDPSDKNETRKKIDLEIVNKNITIIGNQIKKLIPDAIIVNNLDWISKLDFMDFLINIAPYISVSYMTKLKTFAQRLEKNHPFNVQEFLYPILQGYDFLWLYENMNCNAQIGGDQWSNMLTGINLINKKHNKNSATAIDFPLLTTPDGKKMGKSEKGAIFISPEKTTAYDFWQYWRNIDDTMVDTCLKRFTNFDINDKPNEINDRKHLLATEITTWVYSKEEAEKAANDANDIYISKLLNNIPTKEVKSNKLFEIITELKITTSNTKSKRLIIQNAVSIDHEKTSDINYTLEKEEFFLTIGKKIFLKIKILA